MKRYIGTKIVNAKGISRGEYNTLRGWSIPADENPADEGYLVEYADGGQANHPEFAGYISWSPKEVFERSYRATDCMPLGSAIEALKAGKRVARAGWNGKGMWLALVPSWSYNPDSHGADVYSLGCEKLPWIGMKTADGKFVPWLASQTDMLAEDWIAF
ncbi:DUF2829 domain-containing protein [Burkholderia gladioli]|uniref:DUF2829 domain-containing protein n=1 Tax=Burkholderia gladioli TaxID=28095 RepID=UPI003B5073B1